MISRLSLRDCPRTLEPSTIHSVRLHEVFNDIGFHSKDAHF